VAGKFLRRDAIVELIRSEDRTNGIQRRNGKIRYHVDTVLCGCPADDCGGWHTIREARPLPTADEADTILKSRKRDRL